MFSQKILTCIGAAFWLLFLAAGAGAQTEIHRCTEADGNITYSQLPCEADEIPEADEVDNNDAEPADPSEASDTNERVVTKTAKFVVTTSIAPEPDETCQKKYRDAIDEIDAEMRREYTAEKSEQYKKRLLVLTAQLRQC